MSTKGDIGKAWVTLMDNSFTLYRGYRIERLAYAYMFKGRPYMTREEMQQAVDEYIKTGGNKIINSINRK